MSLRYALLGILREGPASGYDLMQLFKVSLHNTWPATQSQIYTELGKLADAGLLSVTARGPRGRKEYSLTDDGLAELRRWLLETEPEPHRNEPMLRVFLLGALTRDQAREYLTYLEKRAARFTDALEALLAKGALNGVHFRTDDLDGTCEKLRSAEAEIVQEPTEQPWGTRDCAVRDPSGNLVRIDQPPASWA